MTSIDVANEYVVIDKQNRWSCQPDSSALAITIATVAAPGYAELLAGSGGYGPDGWGRGGVGVRAGKHPFEPRECFE